MKMKKSFTFGFVFTLLILLTGSVFVSAITGSMGNARMILYPEVNGWTNTVIEKTILVRNVNDVPINIKLETDEEGSKFIELVDEEFILEPDEERKAQFVVKVKKEDTYEGRINVFFSPAEEEGPGVVLSSTIIVIAKKDQGYEEETEEIVGENQESSVAGEVINEEKESKKGTIILLVSSLVLLIILIYLISVTGKKRKNKNSKKKHEK